MIEGKKIQYIIKNKRKLEIMNQTLLDHELNLAEL